MLSAAGGVGWICSEGWVMGQPHRPWEAREHVEEASPELLQRC